MNSTAEILHKLSKCRLAVIGDITLDFYIITNPDTGEISVETGLPTLPVTEFRSSPGGAGNVALNLISLGTGHVSLFGTAGNDLFGKELLRKLDEAGADTSGIIIQEKNWDTHVYTKIINNGTEGNRVDFGNFNIFSKENADRLMEGLEKRVQEFDAVIINQQLKSGIHTEYFRKQLKGLIRSSGKIFITDSRDYPEEYSGTSRKLNRHEAVDALERTGKETDLKGNDPRLAEKLYDLWKEPVFLTLGADGIAVCGKDGYKRIPGIQLDTQLDTVGAGDTMLAAVAAVTAAGFTPEEAAATGNLAASVTVQKLHTTGTATTEEILELEESAVYIHNPELASNPASAEFWADTEIEIIRRPTSGWIYKYALFDHDGTISTLRQGWEDVMEPMMIETITGSSELSREEAESAGKAVAEFIDRTTGIQTLRQMAGLAEMVREFGFVPEQEILSPAEYKEIFNSRLMKNVDRRTLKIKNGELDNTDVTVKGSIDFLSKLAAAGLTIFLASGTDQEDVIREAELLGYADLFNGGIFGATGDIKNEPKRAVIRQILGKIGTENADQIICFGDGPVEIAETKRTGGTTVGIASDELRRYGLNRSKRKRLIRAGADLVVPDYTQQDHLLSLLKGK